MGVLELQTVYAKFEERNRIVAGVTDLFIGTDYESLISQIADIVISSDKPKILYLTPLKFFGRKNDIEV